MSRGVSKAGVVAGLLGATACAVLLAGCQSASAPPAGDASAAAPAAAPATAVPDPAPVDLPPLSAADRETAGQFFGGKTISIIVGSGAGGGFDTTARLVGRHLPKYIPGEPTVIVVNMPGAGGMVAANHLYNAASRDGLTIGIFPEVQVMNQWTGAEGVQFDLRRFNWLGSSYDDPNVCIVRRDSGVKSFKELIGTSTVIAVGGTGPGSNSYDVPRVIAAATGSNVKAVAGYPTTNDVRLGIERGELHGICFGWESVQSAAGRWLTDNYVTVIVQNGATRHRELTDVPMAVDFAKDEESRTLLRLVDAPGTIAKPFLVPPGVDTVRVRVLREALFSTYQDATFQQEAKSMNLEFQPKTAAQIQQVLNDVLAAPPAIAAKYRSIIEPN